MTILFQSENTTKLSKLNILKSIKNDLKDVENNCKCFKNVWTLYYDRYMPIIGTGVPERNPRHISILKMSNVKDKYGQYEAIP